MLVRRHDMGGGGHKYTDTRYGCCLYTQ